MRLIKEVINSFVFAILINKNIHTNFLLLNAHTPTNLFTCAILMASTMLLIRYKLEVVTLSNSPRRREILQWKKKTRK